MIYIDQCEYDKAKEVLKKALAVNKTFPIALVTMGNLFQRTGQSAKAIKYHQKALAFNENEIQALIGLGNAYYGDE
jgi:tetratricopeptide (TPR) repeat protein